MLIYKMSVASMNVHKYTDAKKHTTPINNNAPLVAVIGLFMGLTHTG